MSILATIAAAFLALAFTAAPSARAGRRSGGPGRPHRRRQCREHQPARVPRQARRHLPVPQAHLRPRVRVRSRAMLEGLGTVELRIEHAGWGGPMDVSGPRLADVLETAGCPGGPLATLALDGFNTEISPETLEAHDWVVATRAEGRPLGLGERGPLWLVFDPPGERPATDEEADQWPWAPLLHRVRIARRPRRRERRYSDCDQIRRRSTGSVVSRPSRAPESGSGRAKSGRTLTHPNEDEAPARRSVPVRGIHHEDRVERHRAPSRRRAVHDCGCGSRRADDDHLPPRQRRLRDRTEAREGRVRPPHDPPSA